MTPQWKANRKQSSRGKRWLLHAYRWLVFLSVIWLVRDQHRWYSAQETAGDRPAVSLETVRRFYPWAAKVAGGDPGQAGQRVVDDQGQSLGFVIQTAPESDHIIGYSGSSNTLLAFDSDSRILGIEVLSSGDTPDHLAAVVTNEDFMTAYTGLTWEQAAGRTDVEGVSGATLTSLAIAEGIAHRLGGEIHSYRFPEPLSVAEAAVFFPAAADLVHRSDKISVHTVWDATGDPLGYVARTSPTADDTIGFQGPTDTLLALDREDRLVGLAIRSSYETEEYVGWVRDDRYFMTLFNGKSIEELASLDLWETRVEGVSGATMTSMNVAETLVAAARRIRDERPPPARPIFTIAARDVGTAAIVGMSLLFAFVWKPRGTRIPFQMALVVYLGFVNGDMVSQALLVGWTQGGIPWRFAPGLVLLCAAALLVPLLAQRPLYCVQICPHGAAQHLLAGRLPWRFRLPVRVGRCLAALPALLLAVVVAIAMLHLPVKLAALEPFDAYVFRVAGWSTIAVAVTGLIASAFVPMAYCRYGCPTGGLLEFLRLKGRADRWTGADWAALLIVIAAAVIRVVSQIRG